MITCQTAPEEVSDLLQSFLSWQVSREHLFFNEFNFVCHAGFPKIWWNCWKTDWATTQGYETGYRLAFCLSRIHSICDTYVKCYSLNTPLNQYVWHWKGSFKFSFLQGAGSKAQSGWWILKKICPRLWRGSWEVNLRLIYYIYAFSRCDFQKKRLLKLHSLISVPYFIYVNASKMGTVCKYFSVFFLNCFKVHSRANGTGQNLLEPWELQHGGKDLSQVTGVLQWAWYLET